MDKNEIYCLDCQKKFQNIESYNKEHEKTSYKVLKKEHKCIRPENTLELFAELINIIKFLEKKLEKSEQQNKELSERLESIENLNQDLFINCNILVRNGKNVIKNIGTCFLNFISRCINFRIECKGDILNNDKNKFNIDIIFPFRKAEIMQCNIEKIVGCVSSKEIMDSDGNSVIIFNSYSSYAKQNNSIISIKLLKNYETQGNYEKKKINVLINGTLIFNSLTVKKEKPLLLFNIFNKKFLCYEKNWKFIDNFILDNGLINEGCIISLLYNIDSNNNNIIIIKGKYNYLGYKTNSTNKEEEAVLDIKFHNKIYGLVEITKDDNYLSLDENGNIIFNKEKNYYLLCNYEN